MQRYLDLVSDTICAPITAPGRAGVAVIRVSGDQSQTVIRNFCKLPNTLESHHIYLTDLYDHDEKLDQVLLSYFKKGSSFTGDEVVEVSCHGNPLISERVIHLLLSAGCRMAEPGEFTFRAFYNGKIDLVQAESINELIHAQNTYQARSSIKNLSGGLSQAMAELEAPLLKVMAELEASIDFSEEDIPLTDCPHLVNQLKPVVATITQFISTYDVARTYQQGAKVLLLGSTNVGKSSLFNRLCHEERSIVTDQAGTTRDLVTKQVFLGPYPVELIDSAGLRASDDIVESIGVSLSLSQVNNADLILYVFDVTHDFDNNFAQDLPAKKTFFIGNKIDLTTDFEPDYFEENLKKNLTNKLNLSFLSAHTGEGLDTLTNKLTRFFTDFYGSDKGHKVTQARHLDHLKKSLSHVEKALQLLELQESPDLVSQELMFSLAQIHHILGKEFDDEVLDTIFSQFCIGK